MKALSKQKSEVGIWMIDAAVPEIGPDDVLVKINKTGICGTDPAKAAPCPLCHGLPQCACVRFAPISARMVPHDGWAQMQALRRAAQARNINHSPRAPPVPA